MIWRTERKQILKQTNKPSFRALWDVVKSSNSHVIGVPEWEIGAEITFEEIRVKNFQILWKMSIYKLKNIGKPQAIQTQWKPTNHNQTDK